MSVQLQLRNDTFANWSTVTPAKGECVVDNTNARLLVGTGSNAGGVPQAKLSDCAQYLGTVTVAQMNSLSGLTANIWVWVTDASSPTWNSSLTGGGSTKCKASYNGSAWVAG